MTSFDQRGQWVNHQENYYIEDITLQTISGSLIRTYDEVMNIEETNNLLDWPILKDLESGRTSEVYVDETKLSQIDYILSDCGKRRVLLKGAEGRGKTVLSRLLAHKKYKGNWNIYFIDVRELDSSYQQTLKDEISDIVANNEKQKLFIFENSHISDNHTEELVKLVDYFTESDKRQNSYFLFNSRDSVRDEATDPFDEWKKEGLYLCIEPDNILVERVIEKYLEAKNKNYILSQDDRNWIHNNILPGGDDNNIGGNLRLLRHYL
jgi:SpoVK/Ycf46/Vps4 family AAA+-type ATPase